MRVLKYFFFIPYWIWMSIVFILFLVSSFILSAFFLILFRKNAQKPVMAIYKTWSAIFFFCAGIRIQQVNREILFNNLPCIICCNHGSNLDMYIGAYTVTLNTKPLAKVQLKKMPLLGYLFSAVCVMVDRSSKESREKSSRLMMQEIQNGNSIFLFPEGTRNKSSEPLNPFFDGAFRFAIESQRPIIALCTINARNITPSDGYSVRPGLIRIKYLGPYITEGLSKDDLVSLKEKVRKDMYDVLKNEDPMFGGVL
jgi:1-acyl-sn-glycerol-3-phosphate acyltransferase